jgi:hypothetical protein
MLDGHYIRGGPGLTPARKAPWLELVAADAAQQSIGTFVSGHI